MADVSESPYEAAGVVLDLAIKVGPPAMARAVEDALNTFFKEDDESRQAIRWLPSEALPDRVPPRECVKAARNALDKTYPLLTGRATLPHLVEAVDWLRRALEQMGETL